MATRVDTLAECAQMARTWASVARFTAQKTADPIARARAEGAAQVSEQLARVFEAQASRDEWGEEPTPARDVVIPPKARR